MISKWRYALTRQLQKIWVIASLYALAGVLTPLLAGFIGPILPQDLGRGFALEATATVLNILAASLLGVVTFSIGVMVSALHNAMSVVTPRATSLLRLDPETQRTLAVFLGAFLYSLIGILVLKTVAFSDAEAVVLFAVTLLVLLVLTVMILRWIDHLTMFGLMTNSLDKVERATATALTERSETPCLGASRRDSAPEGAVAVLATRTGHVRNIDMACLQELAEESGAILHIAAPPGTLVHPARTLLYVTGKADADALRDAFSIGQGRDFEQDPRFGLAVLTEIAERALSPGVNDPGTAIDVLDRVLRLLADWKGEPAAEPRFPALTAAALDAADMFEDVFPAIARDGSGNFAVQVRLQKALAALHAIAPDRYGAACARHSRLALERCMDQMQPWEAHRLRAVAVGGQG